MDKCGQKGTKIAPKIAPKNYLMFIGTFYVGSFVFFVASNPYSDMKRTVCDPGNQKVLELLAKSIYFEKYQCSKQTRPRAQYG